MLPLHQAIEDFDEQLVRDLLAAGADPNEHDVEQSRVLPLQLSVDIECERAVRREDAGDPDFRPHATLTNVLLAAGADPDLAGERDETARDWARLGNHGEALDAFDAWSSSKS